MKLKFGAKAEGGFIQNLVHGGGGGYLAGAVVTVRRYCLMNGSTGTRLLSYQLPPLEKYFVQNMEDIAVWRYERVQVVVSDINSNGILGEAGRHSQ